MSEGISVLQLDVLMRFPSGSTTTLLTASLLSIELLITYYRKHNVTSVRKTDKCVTRGGTRFNGLSGVSL